MVVQYISMIVLFWGLFHIVILQAMEHQKREVQYMHHPAANPLLLKEIYLPKIRLEIMAELSILTLNLQP